MAKITEALTVDRVKGFLQYGVEIPEMIGRLEKIGKELAMKISSLEEMEGEAEIDANSRILKECPMVPVLNAIKKDMAVITGKEILPDFYPKVVEGYIQKYPDQGAILHPLCIAHQTIRKTFGMFHGLEIQQIGCRSGATDKRVFSTAGLSKAGITQEEASRKLTGKACIYWCKK